MRIATLQVKDYKCFADSGLLELSPKFNVLVGQNDAGKSTLLEALLVYKPSTPHRSLERLPTPETPIAPQSAAQVTFEVEAEELMRWVSAQTQVVVPSLGDHERTKFVFERAVAQRGKFFATYKSHGGAGFLEHVGPQEAGHGIFNNHAAPAGVNLAWGGDSGGAATYGANLARWLQQRIYVFKAERLNVSESALEGVSVLASNAQNLPDVLNQLSTRNKPRFEKYLGHVRTVFPHITQIAAPRVQGQNVARILVWTKPEELEREDLAVPLAESGTGIGQVLALLYVVV